MIPQRLARIDKVYIKGTISRFQVPSIKIKNDMFDLKRYPFNLYLIGNDSDILVFFSTENQLWFLSEVTYGFKCRNNEGNKII